MEFFCARNIYSRFLSIFFVVFLFLLTFPGGSNALRPLGDDDLSHNSPSLVNEKIVLDSDTHLQPIDENQLDAMSPSLIAPPVIRISSQEYIQIMNQKFENSVCFKQCHHKNDFYPSDHTAKQWRLLIKENGHAIFGKIPWENSQQKEDILNYLLQNARKSKPDAAGIGVW